MPDRDGPAPPSQARIPHFDCPHGPIQLSYKLMCSIYTVLKIWECICRPLQLCNIEELMISAGMHPAEVIVISDDLEGGKGFV